MTNKKPTESQMVRLKIGPIAQELSAGEDGKHRGSTLDDAIMELRNSSKSKHLNTPENDGLLSPKYDQIIHHLEILNSGISMLASAVVASTMPVSEEHKQALNLIKTLAKNDFNLEASPQLEPIRELPQQTEALNKEHEMSRIPDEPTRVKGRGIEM